MRNFKVISAIVVFNTLHHGVDKSKRDLYLLGRQIVLPGVLNALPQHILVLRHVAVLGEEPPVDASAQDAPHAQVQDVEVR